jgi:Ca2+-binding EF-hand superfamily protein
MNTKATECIQKLVDVSAKRWISIQELFDQCDVDKSGGIDKDELQLLLDEVNLSGTVNVDAIWNVLDADNDGEVSRDEWCKCFRTYAPKDDSPPIDWATKPLYKENVP